MKKIVAIALCLGIMGCSAAPDVEEVASVSQAVHSWNGYHWARTSSDPLRIELVDAVTPAWKPFLAEASVDWTASSVIDSPIVPTTAKGCKATIGKVTVCNGKYGRNGWLGIAQVWLSTPGHIVQGLVKLNDTYFSMAQYSSPALKRLVTCQEVGHTYGLDHQDEDFNNANLGTCMDYAANPEGPPSNEHPNAHDYEELEEIYSHVESAQASSTTTGNSAMLTHEFPAFHGR